MVGRQEGHLMPVKVLRQQFPKSWHLAISLSWSNLTHRRDACLSVCLTVYHALAPGSRNLQQRIAWKVGLPPVPFSAGRPGFQPVCPASRCNVWRDAICPAFWAFAQHDWHFTLIAKYRNTARTPTKKRKRLCRYHIPTGNVSFLGATAYESSSLLRSAACVGKRFQSHIVAEATSSSTQPRKLLKIVATRVTRLKLN